MVGVLSQKIKVSIMDELTALDPNSSRYLEQVNQNISVYEKMLKIEMSEESKESIRDEICYLKAEIIPQLKFYDV